MWEKHNKIVVQKTHICYITNYVTDFLIPRPEWGGKLGIYPMWLCYLPLDIILCDFCVCVCTCQCFSSEGPAPSAKLAQSQTPGTSCNRLSQSSYSESVRLKAVGSSEWYMHAPLYTKGPCCLWTVPEHSTQNKTIIIRCLFFPSPHTKKDLGRSWLIAEIFTVVWRRRFVLAMPSDRLGVMNNDSFVEGGWGVSNEPATSGYESILQQKQKR